MWCSHVSFFLKLFVCVKHADMQLNDITSVCIVTNRSLVVSYHWLLVPWHCSVLWQSGSLFMSFIFYVLAWLVQLYKTVSYSFQIVAFIKNYSQNTHTILLAIYWWTGDFFLHLFWSCASFMNRTTLFIYAMKTSYQVFLRCPVSLVLSTSIVIQCSTQSASCLYSTCPNNFRLPLLTLSVPHFFWLWQIQVYQSLQCHTGLTHPSIFWHLGTGAHVPKCQKIKRVS